MRTIIAFVIAPIGIPILLTLIGAIGIGIGWQNQLIGASLSFAPYMALTAWIIGVPVYLLIFKRTSLTKWWHYGLGGVLIAQIPFTIFAIIFSMTELSRILRSSITFTVLGAGSALLFWIIEIKTRPNKHLDKDSAKDARPVS